MAVRYEEYESQHGDDDSVRGHSELLGVVFSWNGDEFDALDPATGKTLDKLPAAEAELAHLRAQLRRQEL